MALNPTAGARCAINRQENHGKPDFAAFQWVSTRYHKYPPNITNSKAVLHLIMLLGVFVCVCECFEGLWAEVATLLFYVFEIECIISLMSTIGVVSCCSRMGDSETAPDMISYNTCISSCKHWPVAVQLQQLATSNQLRQGVISVELLTHIDSPHADHFCLTS